MLKHLACRRLIEPYINGVWCKAINVGNVTGGKRRHVRENNINLGKCTIWRVILVTLLRIRSIVRYL